MSRACRALLTSGSTTVPGAKYFVKYVLRVLQHFCTPCNACVRENCVYMSKSRQLRPEMACSAGGVWWLCSCPQGRIACSALSQCSPAPVQDFCFVAQQYVPCCLCTPVSTSSPTPTSPSADPMSCCDVTKDQNAAVVFQLKQQTCMCAVFELLEFHVLPLRVPLVISPILCSRVPCRVGLRHGGSV